MHALALALNMKEALPALTRLDWNLKSGDTVELRRALMTGTIVARCVANRRSAAFFLPGILNMSLALVGFKCRFCRFCGCESHRRFCSFFRFV